MAVTLYSRWGGVLNFIVLLLFILCFSAHAENGWIAEVRSSYGDVSLAGSGYFIQYKGRVFLVTAAHVSQGGNTQIAVSGKILDGQIIGERLADNLNDLEVIEIPRNTEVPILAQYSFSPRMNVHQFLVDHEKVRVLLDKRSRGTDGFWAASESTFLPMSANSAVITPWRRKGILLHTASSFYEGSRGVKLSRGGNDLLLDVRIAPGMSGLPLLFLDHIEHPNGTLSRGVLLAGTAKSYSRDFEQSRIVRISALLHLLQKFESGERGHLDDFRWKMRSGVSFRESDDFSEISREDPAGNGTEADGGQGAQAKPPATATWHGKKIIGWRLRDGNEIKLFFADMDSYRIIKEAHSVEPILADYRDLARAFRTKQLHAAGYHAAAPCSFKRTGSVVRLKVMGYHSIPEEVWFEIDLKQLGKSFVPVQVAYGSVSGKPYHVDIRGLFFTDPSFGSYSDIQAASIIERAKAPYIMIRGESFEARETVQFCSNAGKPDDEFEQEQRSENFESAQ